MYKHQKYMQIIKIILQIIMGLITLYIFCAMFLLLGVMGGSIDPNSQDEFSNSVRYIIKALN